MADIVFTVRLPEALIERANDAQLRLDDTGIARMIEAEVVRAEAANTLREAMAKLQSSLSLDEIDAELEAAKRERLSDSE